MRHLNVLGALAACLILLPSCDRRHPASAGVAPPPPAPVPSSVVSAPPRPETGRPVEGVPVVATGVIVPDGEGLEICPGDRARPSCPGIAVVGGVDPAFVSAQEPATIVRVPGLYDGAKLEIDGPIQKLRVARDADYRNPCPEFQTVVPAQRYEDGNPSPALSDQSEKIVRAHRDRFAGQWWDPTRGAP